MHKTAVVYRSLYGSTEQYARWIAEALSADLLDASRIQGGQLSPYTTLIFGGGLYAGTISGISVLTKQFEQLRGKNLCVFTVGLANPQDTAPLQDLIEQIFPLEMRKQISFFHLRGGIDYSRLSLKHRIMMFGLKTVIARKKDPSAETRQFLETYGKEVNFCSRSSIGPLLSHIRSLDTEASSQV